MSTLERQLARWQAAGLIDDATAARIADYEGGGRSTRVNLLWAAAGLGGFAALLGLVLLVADRWALIRGAAKLGGILVVVGTASAVTGWLHSRARPGAEPALFVTALLTGGGVALLAGLTPAPLPAWQQAVGWLLLTGPALAGFGATRLTAYLLTTMAAWAAVLAGVALPGAVPQGLAAAAPAALIALGCALRRDDGFAAGLREGGVTLALAGASLAHAAWSSAVPVTQTLAVAERLPLAVAVALLAAWAARRQAERRILWTVLAACTLGTALALGTPHAHALAPKLAGTIAFIAMWGAVGGAANARGKGLLLTASVAMIALRLVIVYFELFGDVATTATGLIAAGGVTVALAVTGRWLVRRTGRKRI